MAHIGGRYPGGFAEFTKAPYDKVRKLPPNVSLDEAAVLDCLAVGVHAINRVRPNIGDTVAIIGAGTIGLSVMQVAKACGARTIVVDLSQSALELARQAGTDHTVDGSTLDVEEVINVLTSGRGADVVYEAVGGRASTIEQAVKIVSRGGRIGLVGSFTGATSIRPFDLLVKEVSLIPAWSYASCGFRSEFDIAIDLLSRGLIRGDVLITHRVSLEDINRGFELMERKGEFGVGKVLVIP